MVSQHTHSFVPRARRRRRVRIAVIAALAFLVATAPNAKAELLASLLPNGLVHTGGGVLKQLPAANDGKRERSRPPKATPNLVSVALAPHVAAGRLGSGDGGATSFAGLPTVAGPALASNGRVLIELGGGALDVLDASGASLLGTPVDTGSLFGGTISSAPSARPAVLFDLDANAFVAAENASDGALFLAVIRDEPGFPFQRYRIASATIGALPGCPCGADGVQIGADQNGFYLSALVRSAESGAQSGAVVFAIGKGTLPDQGHSAVLPLARFVVPGASALAPTVTAPQALHAAAEGGTEYLLEASGAMGFKLRLYAVTNTQSLNTSAPALRIATTELRSEVYVAAPGAGAAAIASPVVLSQGQLWAAMPTGVIDPQGHLVTGAAWFAIEPGSGGARAHLRAQGYVAGPGAGQGLSAPAIAVNSAGGGAIGFTIVGPGLAPSPALAPFGADQRPGPILRLSGAQDGSAPDGAHQAAGAAAIDPADGSLWFAQSGPKQVSDGAPAASFVTHFAP